MALTEYTYFDQFSDADIDMTPYFDHINDDSEFQYSFTNIQPIKTTLKNIFEHIKLVDDFKKSVSFFESYEIQEKESPESVSDKFYGTQHNWWILALFNNMRNMINDWPMSESQMQSLSERMFRKYGKYSKDTYYELLADRNEQRRKIMVLKPIYINDVIGRFRNSIERTG